MELIEKLSSCCSSKPIDEIENMCGACGEITTFEIEIIRS